MPFGPSASLSPSHAAAITSVPLVQFEATIISGHETKTALYPPIVSSWPGCSYSNPLGSPPNQAVGKTGAEGGNGGCAGGLEGGPGLGGGLGLGGEGVGPPDVMHANWTLGLCVQPLATSALVLNQQDPPKSTPAAQPAFAWQSEQHCSLDVAGAESREPRPKSQFGVKVQDPLVCCAIFMATTARIVVRSAILANRV